MIEYTRNEVVVQVQKVCHSLQLSKYHNWRGPKIYTQQQLVALLILKGRENKSLRRFVAWLAESKWPEWLGLREIPSYSTVYRTFQRLGMGFIRAVNVVIMNCCESVKKAFDSTGINMSYRSRHYEKRAKLDYLPNGKLDILADIENFIIEDWHFAVRERHDVLAAKRMIKRIKKCNAEVWADKAYDCEELHQLTHDKGGILLARTRKNSRKRPKGRFRKKVDAIIEAKNKYERPKVETVFSVLKRVYGETIRSTLPHMKKREIAWKIIAMNIEKVAAMLLLYLQIQTIRNRAWRSKHL